MSDHFRMRPRKPPRDRGTFRQRLESMCVIVTVLIVGTIGVRLALGRTWVSDAASRILLIFSDLGPDPAGTPWSTVVAGLAGFLCCAAVGLALLALSGCRPGCRPAFVSGMMDGVELEEAVHIFARRCLDLGFHPHYQGYEMKAGNTLQGEDSALGEADAFLSAIASRHSLVTPGENGYPRAIEARFYRKDGGVSFEAAVRVTSFVLLDMGEAEYCDCVARRLVGEAAGRPAHAWLSPCAYASMVGGTAASLPALFGPLHLGNYYAAGLTFVEITVIVALICGVLGGVQTWLARTPLYGRLVLLCSALILGAALAGTLFGAEFPVQR